MHRLALLLTLGLVSTFAATSQEWNEVSKVMKDEKVPAAIDEWEENSDSTLVESPASCSTFYDGSEIATAQPCVKATQVTNHI